MKRLICCILSVIILVSIAPNCIATEEIVYEYENISVIFEDNTAFSSVEQQYITDMLVYGESDITRIQPRAWCWLTGHDKTTEYVTIITHKKYDTAPRCLEELYEVTTCSKCDLYDMVLVASVDIFCCAEQ